MVANEIGRGLGDARDEDEAVDDERACVVVGEKGGMGRVGQEKRKGGFSQLCLVGMKDKMTLGLGAAGVAGPCC